MSITCPKCGCINRTGAKKCALCGTALEALSFEELFGPPKQLQGRYDIQRTLKRGQVASLYEAIDRQEANRQCLVQEMTTSFLDWQEREDAEERFLKEAAKWQALCHPNIARIADAFVHNRRFYMVSEAVEGIPLADIVQDRRQEPSEATLVHWARQLCDILDYLHNRTPPIVLGYLSPAAIQVDPAGDLKLTDFGLEQLLQSRQAGSYASFRGVPGYEAPEQRRGQLTPQSDIYSLGIILHAVLTHHDPTERPLPALHKRAPHLSEATTRAIVRAFRRDPAKRFASAAEMRDALLAVVEPAAFKITLLPFVLTEGQEVSTLYDLVRLCATYWDDGLRALVNGRIEEWLAGSAQTLRATGQTTKAKEVEEAARRTTQAREKAAQDAARPGMEEIAHRAAFAAWLEEMGAVSVQPRLMVRPRGFDFGEIPPNMKAVTKIQIHNRGQGYLTGHVESPFPWLTVPRPAFGCRAGETTEVEVIARGRRLPAGRSGSPQAILVASNGGQAWLEARAESSQPKLSIEPAVLDFGPIARGGSHVAHLTLSNQGGGLLSGQVISRLPWLRIRHPHFRCPAGATAHIAIELIGAQVPQEASDTLQIRRALVVDSDSGQATIGIAWTWARPGLALDVTALDFGATRRGTQIERALTLSNPGTADLVGQASSKVDWLRVQPAKFQCPPGETQTIQVVCDTSHLPGGDTHVNEAVRIDANAGQQALSVAVEVLAAELVVEPARLDLGTVHDGDDAEMTVTVGNRGSLPWEGAVHSNVPWLVVEPEALLCEPGHFVPLTAVLDTAAFEAGGEWTVEDALQIVGQGEERTVAAHVALARPQLSVARRSLDFGIIGREAVTTLPLELANSGTGELEWRIEWPKKGQDAWLEVTPASGTCRAGEQAVIQVKAYALAVGGDAGHSWLTVHSNAGRADLPASVALSVPTLVVEPLTLDLGASENYAPVSQTLRVTNQGVGRLQGTVTARAPWLSCRPEMFECNSGASTQIEVQALPEGLREGDHDVTEALRIESNGGSEEVGIRLTVALVPRLHLPSHSLRFSRQEPATQQVQMENQGYGDLRLQVVPGADWIKVNRREWTIKGGRKAHLKVTVVLDDAPPDESGMVEIRTPEKVIRLAIRVDEE
jgi:hypothetical protein